MLRNIHLISCIYKNCFKGLYRYVFEAINPRYRYGCVFKSWFRSLQSLSAVNKSFEKKAALTKMD